MAKPTHKRPKSEHVERDANEELMEKCWEEEDDDGSKSAAEASAQ